MSNRTDGEAEPLWFAEVQEQIRLVAVQGERVSNLPQLRTLDQQARRLTARTLAALSPPQREYVQNVAQKLANLLNDISPYVEAVRKGTEAAKIYLPAVGVALSEMEGMLVLLGEIAPALGLYIPYLGAATICIYQIRNLVQTASAAADIVELLIKVYAYTLGAVQELIQKLTELQTQHEAAEAAQIAGTVQQQQQQTHQQNALALQVEDMEEDEEDSIEDDHDDDEEEDDSLLHDDEEDDDDDQGPDYVSQGNENGDEDDEEEEEGEP